MALLKLTNGKTLGKTAAKLASGKCFASQAGADAAQCLQEAITPKVTEDLLHDGFAVVDNVFGDSLSQTLLDEIKSIRSAGLMHLNQTHFVKGGQRSLLEKAGIFEGDLLQSETLAATSHFARLHLDTGFRTMLSLFLPQLRLDAQAIKLQYNAGQGGCFPIHLDSDETVDSRRVTAIAYLNRDWKRRAGGQLRLYPSWSQCVDIEPINDRLVLFSSCRMPHRVLPSRLERYCFSIWLSQSRGASRPPKPLGRLLKGLDHEGSIERATLLSEPEMRKALTKLAFADEWAASLMDSHPDTEARTTALDNFEKERQLLQSALSKVLPEFSLIKGNMPPYRQTQNWLSEP